MASEARHQKKLAKQKAKRREKQNLIARQTSKDPTVRFARASDWPVVDTLVKTGIFESGIGIAIITRRMPDGGFGFASLTIDTYCMGVKDCYVRAITQAQRSDMLAHYRKDQELDSVRPEYFVKLVTEAVAYAQALGLPPHADYRHSCLLFAGIDPAKCSETFEFGRDGAPLYIQGPSESMAQARAIMQKVRDAGGHYILSASSAEALGFTRRGVIDDAEEVAFENDPRN